MSKPSRPAPPPPRLAPKPGLVKVFKALYPYRAQQADELSFEEGDVLYVNDMSDSGWWKATCEGRSGLIPSNYVEEGMESVDNPMHEAAKRGNMTFLKECLANRVAVNGLDKAGCTALHWAAHGGHTECVQELLKVPSIRIDQQNKIGDTALHNAAWKGHADVVELLLNRGARPDLRNQDNKLASELATEPQTAAILKRRTGGAPADYNNDYGNEEDSD
ncbi:osteoclast-stimulating factor 1-like [Branchiostoma floridae]|uniref:Osteoclast-stimulating factor 1 n=1 Tax=Branchiostoma floridae TaxID=7739 RepID=A0A9J7HP18_BRAFL|nr:osteoclast-stimulating factor 1-like [Branchiostoma floridae]